MHSLWNDARFGFRTLLKDRGFLVAAVLALALGIGSTTAIFSVIDNVLLRPFPYTDGQRLMAIQIRDKASTDQYGREAFSVPEFLDYQEQNHVFDRTVGVTREAVLMTGAGNPESFDGATVTGNTFQFLGVGPLLGRTILPSDAQPGAPPVFVLSYKLWQKRFAGDPSILGKTFIMNDKPSTLIGIMPARFAWWGADLWVPTALDRAETGPTARYFFMLGHLKPGLAAESATADIRVLAQRFAKLYPKQYPKQFDVSMPSLVDNVVGKFRNTLYTLLAAVSLLLLIACANVANLLLAKATARQMEFAIRTTMGASRWQLIRQVFIESLLLALAGAAAGCLFAWAGLKGLVALIPKFTFPDEAVIHLNLPVLAFTVAVAVFTALLFGLAPALGATDGNLHDPLKSGTRGNTGFRRGRLRNILIVSEVALSLVLLVGAGLLMRSFFVQRHVDLGFRTDNVITTEIRLTKRYQTEEQQTRFLREVLVRFQAIPGVVSAAGALAFPPFGGIDTDFDVPGKTHADKWKGQMVLCSSQFLPTIGARLLSGRLLTEDDINQKRKVALINQTMAKKFFAGEDPIGRRVKLENLANAPVPVDNPWFEIIGVASDMKNHGVRDAVQPEVYAPYTFSSYGGFLAFLRTVNNPASSITAMTGAVLAMDHAVIPQNTNTMVEVLELNEYAKPRFGLILFSVFAAIGVVLVSVGVYSVISYTVTQQTRDIGIRLALGASTRNVRDLVMFTGLRLMFVGVCVGLVLAFILTRVMSSEFWGVSAYDPLTLGGVIFILAIVGLTGCYLPSRRATRVDPMVSLRYE